MNLLSLIEFERALYYNDMVPPKRLKRDRNYVETNPFYMGPEYDVPTIRTESPEPDPVPVHRDVSRATHQGYEMRLKAKENYVSLRSNEHNHVNCFHIGTFMGMRDPGYVRLTAVYNKPEGLECHVLDQVTFKTNVIILNRKRLRKLMRTNLKKFVPKEYST